MLLEKINFVVKFTLRLSKLIVLASTLCNIITHDMYVKLNHYFGSDETFHSILKRMGLQEYSKLSNSAS